MTITVPVKRELSARCSIGGSHDTAFESAATDWRWRSAHGGIYALYQEMEDKDGHLFSVLQTRKNALLACAWKVAPADESSASRRAAVAVEQALGAIPNLHNALFHLLDALAKGFAVAEILWQTDPNTGAVWPESIAGRPQADFAFDQQGALWLLEPAGCAREFSIPDQRDPHTLLPRPGESRVMAQGARRMPDRKFLHFAFQGSSCSPYGAGLCANAYWYYWFKKNNLRFWAIYNEKFGAPTAIARYNAATSDEELRKLEELVRSLQSDSGFVVPEGVALELLEARRSGAGDTYRTLADWCNDELSKIVLGQTLTTSEGRRSGSLALATVHDNVRRDYLAADARALGEMLTNQLARWITDFNLGTDVRAPRVVFDCADPAEFAAELDVDRELVKMGVSLPASYFYERYRRPQPAAGQRALRYDDANLYQYHLMFGVLTINEVRATLGMAPVPWGDHPPQPASTTDADALMGTWRGRSRSDKTDGDQQEQDGTDEARRDRKAR